MSLYFLLLEDNCVICHSWWVDGVLSSVDRIKGEWNKILLKPPMENSCAFLPVTDSAQDEMKYTSNTEFNCGALGV